MTKENILEKFQSISGLETLDQEKAKEGYLSNTMGLQRDIPGALRPTTVQQVQEIVKVAEECKATLFAFSTGHNWGFGSSLPTIDNCFIVDLSGMKKIIEFNQELGYVTLEPGVTQRDLSNYMIEHNIPFMVPTTGAGPTCSIIGNALERGYGLTPDIDHFRAVLAIEAVLPNGKLYRSSFSAFNADKADKIYKWKVGPYLDGIFSQGNFGIVTQATIAIERKPEHIEQFIAFVDQKDLTKAVRSIAITKERYGSMIGGINLMNIHRLMAMVEKKEAWKINGVVPEEHLHRLAKKRGVPDWGVLIGIYSPDEIHPFIKRGLKKEFGRYARHSLFLNRKRLTWISRLLSLIPSLPTGRTIKTISLAFEIMEGIPNEAALPLAYLKNPNKIPAENFNPDRDGSGLLWYTPVLPVEGKIVEEFTEGVKEIMISEKLEPMITLTAISQRCLAANIPIVFNRQDQQQCEAAHRCLDRMMDFAQRLGIFPDRLDIRTIRRLYDNTDSPSFELARKIKDAVDPKHILSPGRYMKLPQ